MLLELLIIVPGLLISGGTIAYALGLFEDSNKYKRLNKRQIKEKYRR